MSVSSQPVESINWKPSISEIAELLQSLGISPPQSFDDNLFLTTPISCQNSSEFADREESEILEDVSEGDTTLRENFDRERTIELLKIAREDGKSIKWINNYFHDYLVEHFKRKQMMHVYTDGSEEDVMLNEYLRKLDELERSNEELRGSREEWDAELTRTRADIRGKSEDAREAVDEMIVREREVGTSTWYCGKSLSIRRVQALISRQLDRIKDIAKFRIRYTRLRDEFIATEMEMRRNAISSPNLTKEDYERLEAEQFYYKRELSAKDKQCDEYCQRRNHLVIRMDSMLREIMKINRIIDNSELCIVTLKNNVKRSFEERKICLAKLADAKQFVHDFNEIIGQSERPEFSSRMTNIRKAHEEWMRTISVVLRDIKNLGQSLSALRANLILHGKDLEKMTMGDVDKTLCRLANDKNRREDLQ